MKINIRALIAVVLVVVVAYVAFDMVSTKTVSGSEVSVSISNGSVTINNATENPVMARITSRTTFRLAGSESDLTLESTRVGSGRNATQVFEGELPGGDLELQVVRGSDMTFELTSEDPITVTAVPRAQSEATTVVVIAAVMIIALLYYASNATGHAWLRSLRQQRAPSTGAGEQVGAS